MASSIILIMMASVALVSGVEYVRREKEISAIHRCLFIQSLCIFLWDFGYGIMGLTSNYDYCYIWRAIAIAGSSIYVIMELIFVRTVTGTIQKGFNYVCIGSGVLAAVATYMVCQPSVVRFFEYNGRTAYESAPSPGRTIQAVFISIMFITMFVMAIVWFTKMTFKREKETLALVFCAHMALILSVIPDTLLPSFFGTVSYPSSGMGGFICFIFNVFAADRRSAFNLSSEKMSDYIYHNVKNSIMFFDSTRKLIFANEYSRMFFSLDDSSEYYFRYFFQISEEEAKELFLNQDSKRSSEGIHLITREKNIPCSVILNTVRDRFGEPVYTACMIYDLSEEVRLYDSVNTMKLQLQDELKRKTHEMESLSLQSIKTIANTIDAKDEYTKGHSERVAVYSTMIAKRLGWSEDQIANLKNAALLHDIGKIGIADSILNKSDSLTDEEYEILKDHTTIGAEILKDITLISGLDEGAKYHHERYDGKGYPNGLSGEDIPEIARIICIADAFDAMNSKRIYRNPLSEEKIILQLKEGRGKQFDPYILDIFVEICAEEHLIVARP